MKCCQTAISIYFVWILLTSRRSPSPSFCLSLRLPSLVHSALWWRPGTSYRPVGAYGLRCLTAVGWDCRGEWNGKINEGRCGEEVSKNKNQRNKMRTKFKRNINYHYIDWLYTVVQKNAPTLAYYNYDPVQSILIFFSKLFANDHKSCLVIKFFTSPHMCCHYTLWNTMLYFALIALLISKKCANFRSP